MTATWSFDDRAMEGVEELAYGLPVSLAELPGGELVIAANTDDNDTVLIEVSSLVFWLQHHRPDLLPKFYA